jgi:DNA-binding NarL/FixJ family response regulator
MTAPSRVLVADDHAPTREDVRAAVEADPRFTVVATAGDAADAIQAALRERPDVALLDMRMPGSGAAAAWEITARLPDTRAVMLTVSRSDEDLFAALRAGSRSTSTALSSRSRKGERSSVATSACRWKAWLSSSTRSTFPCGG